jgi:hypothetical protein
MVTETETKVEEKEVEVVYCDKCGDECTDDHKIEPSEVCKRCSSESAVDRLMDLARPGEDSFGKDIDSIAVFIGLVILFPVVFILSAFGTQLSKGEKMDFLLHSLGMAVWVLAIVAFMLLLL